MFPDELGAVLHSVAKARDETIDLLRELVRTPSPSGREQDVAEIVRRTMIAKGYDEVKVDAVGNVIGVVKGDSNSKPLLYDAHMDTVPPGGMEDPFSARLEDGAKHGLTGQVVYGRGASDMKASLAAMITVGAILKELGIRPKHDLVIAAVVMEEDYDAFGVKHLVEKTGMRPGRVISGENTNLNVALGHLGMMPCEVVIHGVSVHSSAPDRGLNALYKMSDFIQELRKVIPNLPVHRVFGKPSMSVNTIGVRPGAENVVPDYCRVVVDVRTTPDLDESKVLSTIREVIATLAARDPQIKAEVNSLEKEAKSYTGYSDKIKLVDESFYTDPQEPFVTTVRDTVEKTLNRKPGLVTWRFATDTWYFSKKGAVTVGFGPGEERFAHTVQESIRVDDIIAAMKVYAALPLFYS